MRRGAERRPEPIAPCPPRSPAPPASAPRRGRHVAGWARGRGGAEAGGGEPRRGRAGRRAGAGAGALPAALLGVPALQAAAEVSGGAERVLKGKAKLFASRLELLLLFFSFLAAQVRRVS